MLSQSYVEKVSSIHGADDWFAAHPTAKAIVDFYAWGLTASQSEADNMLALLKNFCAYAKENNWHYLPVGGATDWDAVLRAGDGSRTDCGSLANMVHHIATHLGIKTELRHILKPDYRCVTKPGLKSFDDKSGSTDIGGRWCFGDHWVVLLNGMCYDPSFNDRYPQDENFTATIEWWAMDYYKTAPRDVRESKGFPSSGVFLPEGVKKWDPRARNNIYIKMDGEYTFDYNSPSVLKREDNNVKNVSDDSKINSLQF